MPLRLVALLGLLIAIWRSLVLARLPQASRGWRRGWVYITIMASVLALRSLMILLDLRLPDAPFRALLRHPIGLGLTSLAVAVALNGLIEEMRRIFVRRITVAMTPMPVAQVVMDWRGLILTWNEAATALLGWTEAEVKGRELLEIAIPEELEVEYRGVRISAREAHREGLKHFRETGRSSILNTKFITTALHQDGRRLSVEVRVTTHLTPEGQITFLGQLSPAPAVIT